MLSRVRIHCSSSSSCLPFCLQNFKQGHRERRTFLEKGMGGGCSRQQLTPKGQLCP